MKNAFLIRDLTMFFLSLLSRLASTSSVITIWSSTPVPIDAIIPAIAAKSKFQCVIEANPRIIINSDKLVITIGTTNDGDLYLNDTTATIASSASNPATREPISNCEPNSADTLFTPLILLILELCVFLLLVLVLLV